MQFEIKQINFRESKFGPEFVQFGVFKVGARSNECAIYCNADKQKAEEQMVKIAAACAKFEG